MAAMNNWLAFNSLSPHELRPSQHEHQEHTQSSLSPHCFNSDEISGADVSGESYQLTSNSNHHASLNLSPSFGICEAFQKNHHHHRSNDWNMKGLGLMSSDMLMAGGGSCSAQNLENQEPKLENFLAGHSFSGHDHTKLPGRCNSNNFNIASAYDGDHYNMYSLHLPSADQTRLDGGDGGGGNSNTFGLSMIKTWLRNQPADSKSEAGAMARNIGTLTSTHTLSLSMSTGGAAGESSSSDTNMQNKAATGGCGGRAVDSRQTAAAAGAVAEAVPRKSIDTSGQRTSIYRGVTRHRWTGRYEAHLWDNSCRREGQTRKGRQVYLGGYDKEDKAARAYDLSALKYWGTNTTTNFPISNYEKELEEMKHMTRQEYVASLRRKSSGFSRGASIYRGVTRHHQHGRWQARIGRVAGNKDLYLGTFTTQEEAAEAYDRAAIKFRGLNAVTNFDMNRYDVKSIIESPSLPTGAAAKRLKEAEPANRTATRSEEDSRASQLTDGINNYASCGGWPTIAFQNPPPPPFSDHHSPYSGHHPAAAWCKQEQDSFQDFHQPQLGSTHNFFQQHNLMSMDSSSMEHSSVIYCRADQYGCNNRYVIPIIGTTVNGNGFGETGELKPLGDHTAVYGDATDPYHVRNLYYISQQSNGVKPAAYDQGSAGNNWVPAAVPAPAPSSDFYRVE